MQGGERVQQVPIVRQARRVGTGTNAVAPEAARVGIVARKDPIDDGRSVARKRGQSRRSVHLRGGAQERQAAKAPVDTTHVQVLRGGAFVGRGHIRFVTQGGDVARVEGIVEGADDRGRIL